MNQKIEISNYQQIFYSQLNYLSKNAQRRIYENKIDKIVPYIEKTIKFVDSYDLGEHQEIIRMNAVAVLPFMMVDVVENPNLETKKAYKESLQFLEYIKDNKGISNHLIYNITTDKKDNSGIGFDDFYGFDINKIDKEIEIYKYLSSMKINPRRKWFSNILQLNYLCVNLISHYGSKEKLIIDFLDDFFIEFNKEVDRDIIKQKIIRRAKQDDFVRLNPITNTLIPSK